MVDHGDHEALAGEAKVVRIPAESLQDGHPIGDSSDGACLECLELVQREPGASAHVLHPEALAGPGSAERSPELGNGRRQPARVATTCVAATMPDHLTLPPVPDGASVPRNPFHQGTEEQAAVLHRKPTGSGERIAEEVA
jgi:hypothetical protein